MIRTLLAPFGLAFGQAAQIRGRLYDKDIFRRVRLSKPVVSIGNVTVGGTGKTPFVDAVLTQLEKRHLRCAVLSRGYGREAQQALVVNASANVRQAGDEPLWLFQRHPTAKIAVGADRVASAADLDADIFILDDGFQHRRILRDLEIVLLDCSRPPWHYHPLPWGYAREGLSSLARADLIVLTRTNQANATTQEILREQARRYPHIPVIESTLVLEGYFDLQTAKKMTDTTKLKVFLYSAIGNPASFRQTVSETPVTIVGEERARDHAPLDGVKIGALGEKAAARGAQAIVVTEKDAVKWREAAPAERTAANAAPLPVLVARTTLNFKPALPDIYDLCNHVSR